MSYELASYFMLALVILSIIGNIINERYYRSEVRYLRNKIETLRNQNSDRYNDGYNDGISDASMLDKKEYEIPEFMKEA